MSRQNDITFEVTGPNLEALRSAADARLSEFFAGPDPSGLSWWFSVTPFVRTGGADVLTWQATVTAEW